MPYMTAKQGSFSSFVLQHKDPSVVKMNAWKWDKLFQIWLEKKYFFSSDVQLRFKIRNNLLCHYVLHQRFTAKLCTANRIPLYFNASIEYWTSEMQLFPLAWKVGREDRHHSYTINIKPLPVSLAKNKNWKQGETASMTLPKSNKTHLPAPWKLINKHQILFI